MLRNIQVNCRVVLGQYFEFASPEDFEIHSDKPILVGQFMASSGMVDPNWRPGQPRIGDPAFTLGAYWNSFFAVPTVSDPYGRVAASPYPQPMLAPATVKGYMGPAGGRMQTTSNRFAGRYA